MVEFLSKYNLFNTPFSVRVLKSRSMPNILYMFFEEITKWGDEGSPLDKIYLGFQKAFDKVPHQRILFKLQSYSIGISIINWIEQWLTDRRKSVAVDGDRQPFWANELHLPKDPENIQLAPKP